MNRNELTELIRALYSADKANFVRPEDAIRPELAGMKIFDEPLCGIGAADDALFAEYKKPGIIGPWFKTPEEWLPGAKTVVALFFPFSKEVRHSNRMYADRPSDPWLHGRIEGQIFLRGFIDSLREALTARGIAACTPMTDARFADAQGSNSIDGYESTEEMYTSNWSERHAAYVCGLGTFGLHKSLITEKGTAGRFTSVIIDAPLTPDTRDYTGIYDYCIRCGECARRCAGHAITPETGKDHSACRKWVSESSRPFLPRYGCGLCQTGVPCEDRNPSRK